MSDSPELRELRKQTRMMAEKEASRTAAVLLILGLCAGGWLGLSGWPLAIVTIGAGVLGWFGGMKAYAGD